MPFRKLPICNLQPGLAARPWREHWRGARAVFSYWEADGSSIYLPGAGLHAVGPRQRRRPKAHSLRPAVYFPGSSANEVETAGDHPITFASGEPYTLAMLIRWANTSGIQAILRSGSSSSGTWLWVLSSGKLWVRHADVVSPSSGSGPAMAPG